MDTKKFNKKVFISGLIVLLFSIIGLVMLKLPYFSITTNYAYSATTDTTIYSGYDLIFQNINSNAEAEAILHFIGFIFFFAGSLIFVLIELSNSFKKDESKKIVLKLSGISNSKKTLKTLKIISSILLLVVSILIFTFSFLSVKSGYSYISYGIGKAKTVAGILLGLNFLVLAYDLNLVFNCAISNLPKEETKPVEASKAQ